MSAQDDLQSVLAHSLYAFCQPALSQRMEVCFGFFNCQNKPALEGLRIRMSKRNCQNLLFARPELFKSPCLIFLLRLNSKSVEKVQRVVGFEINVEFIRPTLQRGRKITSQCFAKLLKLGDPLEDFFRLAKASFQFGLDILVPVKNFMKSMHESTEHRIFRRVTELIA
jgi:hypothetical protein